ncbi:receptor-type tyrosine-protein phosphatase N2 [Lingula anatina]|uniref:Receptor-type tyrosine-protein phosphatase N2 n=1 Tax=Lingula anatina TaxID=7574 RepID=A0A1S3J5A1_LINAN|nr:receptor-type tyrosine-protein phosphatase N2 [Lingula anatina]|eukprot:XP_013405560.1 receptor-type tyrosine-protein phosphatase N2 [Lingula anatina]
MVTSRGLSVVVVAVATLCWLTAGASVRGVAGLVYGCRFEISLCDFDEKCTDDLVFGYCVKRNEGPNWRLANSKLELDPITTKLLEQEIRHLIRYGYTWDDPYTQCILGNFISSYKNAERYERTLCYIYAKQARDIDDISATLKNDYSENLGSFFNNYLVNTEKRVQDEQPYDPSTSRHRVHKYYQAYPAGYSSNDLAESYNVSPRRRRYRNFNPNMYGEIQKKEKSPITNGAALSPEDLEDLNNYLTALQDIGDEDQYGDQYDQYGDLYDAHKEDGKETDRKWLAEPDNTDSLEELPWQQVRSEDKSDELPWEPDKAQDRPGESPWDSDQTGEDENDWFGESEDKLTPLDQAVDSSARSGLVDDVAHPSDSIPPEDAKLLDDILEELPWQQVRSEDKSDELPWDPDKAQDRPGESPWESDQTGEDENDWFVAHPGDSIPPEDAKLLDDILEGRRDIASLSEAQIDRLTKYVTAILAATEKAEDTSENSYDLYNNEEETKQITSAPPGVTDGQAPAAVFSKEQLPKQARTNPEAIFSVSIKSGVKKNYPGYEARGANVAAKTINSAASNSETELAASSQDTVKKNYVNITFEKSLTQAQAHDLLNAVAEEVGVRNTSFTNIRLGKNFITFYVDPKQNISAYKVASKVATVTGMMRLGKNFITFYVDPKQNISAYKVASKVANTRDKLGDVVPGVLITNAFIGKNEQQVEVAPDTSHRDFVLTFVLCGFIAIVLITVVVIYLVQRHSHVRKKLRELAGNPDNAEASADYQDLCRQRMQSKASEKPEPIVARVGSVSNVDPKAEPSPTSRSSKSSTSSWSEEPVSSNMDISTGHVVLSYMEDHLKNKDRLDREWEALCAYEAEPNTTEAANLPNNTRKNRYCDILPYDHSRVVLNDSTNVSGGDYINASTITDHDPRNPAYIATQGPLPHTVADFWQLVWEQGSVVIVMLTKLTENGVAMCHRYWPEEGSDLYHIYEVHLVSEHIWCEDFLVRSFYLKNLQTGETRTVTQFHFLSWPDLEVPSSVKSLLDFRRKVNKSYRGRSCPITVHCSDGSGRTGTYCLVDMVLNRMAKGAKEIDIAATLEHVRDQRMGTVKTKEQFEFVLAAVAEEVHAILKALPQ